MQAKDGEIRVWISKSGKEGLGATVEARIDSSRGECVASVEDARLVIDGTAIDPAAPPPSATMAGGEPAYLYLPFIFDNEAMWNDGRVRGTLHLAMKIDCGRPAALDGTGGRIQLDMPIRHVWDGPHKQIDRYKVKPGLVRP